MKIQTSICQKSDKSNKPVKQTPIWEVGRSSLLVLRRLILLCFYKDGPEIKDFSVPVYCCGNSLASSLSLEIKSKLMEFTIF